MYLLPAIGAWISDGLLLYIYLSENGQNGAVPNNNERGERLKDFVTRGNSTTPCRRIQTLDGSYSQCFDAITKYKKSTRSSFPNSPNDLYHHSYYNRTQDSFVFQEHGSQSSSVTPENESSKIANDGDENSNNEVGISTSTIQFKTRYLSVLAIIRLLLLTFPLSYAAYSGTRVPCVIVQYLFHGISSIIVISHMLAVLILERTSLNMPRDDNNILDLITGVGRDDAFSGRDTSSGARDDNGGDAWTLLSLSLVSILLHFLIVLHVRSTGPIQDGLYEEKRERKRLAYAMAARSNSAITRAKSGLSCRNNGPLTNVNLDDDDDEELAEAPLLLPQGDNNSLSGHKTFKERLMCFPDQYEAFVSDTQARFDAARRMWSDRLEIATQSLHQNNMNNSAHGEGRYGVVLQTSPLNLESSNLLTQAINTAASNATKLVPLKPDPFRVLLQLFAYEDVWSGTQNRLDVAFSPCLAIDGTNISNHSNSGQAVSSEVSAALSFYAPQLLSFLLHGAYFDISIKLEDWILKKCGQDLHFAHRCFWFLRSWCLGSSSEAPKPSHAHSLSSSSIAGGMGGIDVLSLEPEPEFHYGAASNTFRGLESNLYLSYCQGLLPAAPSLFLGENSSFSEIDPPGSLPRDFYSGANGFKESTSSKFSPDEQALIEQLLHRVVERGSHPATVAQYGSIDGRVVDDYNWSDTSNDFACSPSALATVVAKGLVPVDPRTGFHSTAHLDCITAAHKHGFLPLNNLGEPYQKPSPSNDASFLFFAAPIFLDALLSIADDLMKIGRPNRTVELRQRLRSLEVELLPSNVVYLPIQNMQHRVWRIVADESLALSTNERVPCIITLEVIECGVHNSFNQQLNSMATIDSAITSAWVKASRPPHRHSTLIDNVAKFTQEGLRRLEDTFEGLSAHGSGEAGALERRLADFLGGREGSRKNSPPVYNAVDSDDDEAHIGPDEEAPGGRELDDLQTPSKTGNKDENDEIMQLCPPPPLGDLLVSDNLEAMQKMPGTPKSTSNGVTDDVQDVQESSMGQWSTPKKNSLILGNHHTSPIENIPEDDTDEEYLSLQAKQHKKVVLPPSTNSRVPGGPVSDELHMAGPVEPEDTDAIVPTCSTPAVVFKEDWKTKTERLRKCSIYGTRPGWRLLPILIKSNDDLRQEQLASQLIQRMALILAKTRVPVWLYPYEIVALTGRGGIIECVPDTISIDSLKRNDPNFTSLKTFFEQHFGRCGSDELANAKANFVESLAAYSIVCFLMQLKDRHNGNILLDNIGHIVHIDFGFYFLSSPGKNSGFESAPFKLTRDFVNLMNGPNSRTFQKFRELCYKTFIELRKNCYQIILLVEMLVEGNEDLACFRGRPKEAVRQLKERFRLDLNDNGIRKYVDSLIDESLENWRTRWYDRYQRFCVGVL